MKEALERISLVVDKISCDVTELLVSDGRKHERLKSLESSRRWACGIIGTVIAAIIMFAVDFNIRS
jgi:hypothetical protein